MQQKVHGSTTLRWIPAVVYAAGIFAASSIPGRAMPVTRLLLQDKLVHAVVFAGLGALLYRACRRVWLTALLGGAYGVLDELHQRVTRGRSSELWDAVADAIGVLVGALAAWSFLRSRGQKLR